MRKLSLIVGIMLACGCAGRPSMLPNSDPNLRKTSAQFAADAAKRHPYKADAPRGGEAVARAEVDYTADFVNIVNLSDEEMDDVELWINQNYVVFIPKMEPKLLKKINFTMLYDDTGATFPTDNRKVMIEKAEQDCAHPIERRFPVHRVQIRNGHHQMIRMCKIISAGLARFKAAHHIQYLSF